MNCLPVLRISGVPFEIHDVYPNGVRALARDLT